MISTPVATEPQPTTPEPTTGISRLQLAAIGAVVALAAGIGLVLGLTVLSGRGESALGPSAAYVPADAAIYMEARLDLPAGQRESLRAILERFPAADADAILTDALATTLDEALASMTPALFDYSSDIAPWFDGRVAMSLLEFPASADPMSMQLPAGAAMFGVRDAAAAGEFAGRLREALEANGSEFTSVDHAGVTIWALEADASMPMAGVGFAYALTDDQLLLANGPETLETMLDVHAGNGDTIAQREELRDLSEHLPPEWVGVMTVDAAALVEQMSSALEQGSPAMVEAFGAYLESVPSFVVTTIGFEDDAVRFDGATTMPDGDLAPSNSRRDLAASIPADAIFFADGPAVGQSLVQSITGLRSALAADPTAELTLQQIQQMEAALGANLEDFVSWIGSGAIAGGWDGSAPWFGLALEASDPGEADRRLGQLRALVELAAMDPSTQVELSTALVGDVEVTTVSVNSDPMAVFAQSNFVVQYALDGGTALIGVGEGFVSRALKVTPGDSLAGAQRFTAAVDRFGDQENAGAFFVDLAALLDAVEAAVPNVDGMPGYTTEIKPNLQPLDYLAGVTMVENGAVVSRFGLVLR